MANSTKSILVNGLVIVLIVGVVGSIAFPVFAGDKGPRKTICLSNMKHLGTGTIIYATDFDEVLPVRPSAAGPSAVGWGARIYPYVKNPYIFFDPFEKEAQISYAMNANAAELPKLSGHSAPDRSVMLFEIENARRGRNGKFEEALLLSPVGDGAANGLLDSADPNVPTVVRTATGPLLNSGLNAKSETRHEGRSTFVFLDGHARMHSSTAVSAGANARSPRDTAKPNGCVRPDLPGRDRPCAEGTAVKRTVTFSLP